MESVRAPSIRSKFPSRSRPMASLEKADREMERLKALDGVTEENLVRFKRVLSPDS